MAKSDYISFKGFYRRKSSPQFHNVDNRTDKKTGYRRKENILLVSPSVLEIGGAFSSMGELTVESSLPWSLFHCVFEVDTTLFNLNNNGILEPVIGLKTYEDWEIEDITLKVLDVNTKKEKSLVLLDHEVNAFDRIDIETHGQWKLSSAFVSIKSEIEDIGELSVETEPIVVSGIENSCKESIVKSACPWNIELINSVEVHYDETSPKSAVTVMVITDTHLIDKKNLSKVSVTDGKMNEISEEIFDTTLEMAHRINPDVILFCGDMTFNGEESGHRLFKDKINVLKEEGFKIFVVPGNHDISQQSISLDDNAKTINKNEFIQRYGMLGIDNSFEPLYNFKQDSSSLSWAGMVKGTNLALIGLSSVVIDEANGTHYNGGYITKTTLQWLKSTSKFFTDRGITPIVFTHHNIVEHIEGQKTLIPSTLVNTDSNVLPSKTNERVSLDTIHNSICDTGIKNILTGHFHIHNTGEYSNEASSFNEITTSSLISYPCAFRVLNVNTKTGEVIKNTTTFIHKKFGSGEDLQSKSLEKISAEVTRWYPLYATILINAFKTMISNIECYRIYDGMNMYMKPSNGIFVNGVEYEREFKTRNWEQFVLAVDLNYSDWSSNFEIATITTLVNGTITFTPLKAGSVYNKNTPALIRLKSSCSLGKYIVKSTKVNKGNKYLVMANEDDIAYLNNHTQVTYIPLTGEELADKNAYVYNGKTFDPIDDKDANTFKLLPQRWYLYNVKENRPQTYDVIINN